MRQNMLCVLLIVALAAWAGSALASGGEEEGGTGTSGGSGGTSETATGGGSATGAETPTIEGDSSAARPLFQQGQQAYTQGQYAQAAELFERAYDTWHHPAFQYNRGQALARLSRWQDALAAFQQYVSLYPTSGLPAEQFDTVVHIQMADCLYRLNRRDEATQALRRYLEASPQGDLAPAVRHCIDSGAAPSTIGARDPQSLAAARRLFNEGVALYQRGQYREAAQRFRQAYDQHNDMPELIYDVAVAYRRARMWTEAIDAYRTYLQTPAAGAVAYVGLAQCYHEQADYERAIEAYQQYVQREPNGPQAQEAREYIRSMRAVLSSSEGPPAQERTTRAREHFDRGTQHYLARRYREAITEFQQAYGLLPSPAFQYNIGMCNYRMEEWVDAVTAFETFLRDGDSGEAAEAHLYAAECWLNVLRWGDAQRHIQEYISRADAEELPNEERDRARAQQLTQRVRQASGVGGSS